LSFRIARNVMQITRGFERPDSGLIQGIRGPSCGVPVGATPCKKARAHRF